MRLKTKYLILLNLATTTFLTAVENKIPYVSKLVKKLTITQKLVKLKIKLLLIMIVIIILLLNLSSENFTATLPQTNLASKNDIAKFVKKTDFEDKLKSLNKIELKKVRATLKER